MGIFDRFRNKQTFNENKGEKPIEITFDKQQFGTPIVKIGGGDITKPFIQSFVKDDVYVRFGHDNLYPQLIDQMYYQSPLHSGIIDFQINATIGGGWEIISKKEKTPVEKVKEIMFIKKNKLDKLIRGIALDIKMHGRSHVIVYKKDGKPFKLERILPAKVRYSFSQSKFWISHDWMSSSGTKTYSCYSPISNDEISVMSFIDLENSPGQDVYPLVKEISVFNWIFLDGQSSTLQKLNIEKSIFGTTVIKRPKEFASEEEFDKFKKDVSNKEGKIVPVLVFAANGKDNLPEIESFPANQNDKVFEGMFGRIDEKICQAHSINPSLFLQTPGSLGGGSDIEAFYPKYEKNVIKPNRTKIEEFINDILQEFGITGEFKLKDFQFINGVTTEVKTEEQLLSETKVALPTVNDNLKGLSAAENADVYRIIRDYTKGRLSRPIADARLKAYGFDEKTITEILDEKN